MLLMAMAMPEAIDIRGITAVAGNVPVDLTERNARIMCELAGRTDVAVYRGCARPMVRKLVTAEAVHGRTGIDGIDIAKPAMDLQDTHAVNYLIEALMEAPAEGLTLVPTGPLTNIAMAMVMEPAIVPRIREIVLMGGAMQSGGNTSPAAEFNMLVDPQAAHVVFTCGRPIVVMGLDVTHQVLTTPTRLAAIGAIGNKVGAAVHSMLEFYDRHDIDKYGEDGGPLHDPCTIAYLLKPELFQGKLVHVAVEVRSELTMGATVVDYWSVTGHPRNALWITHADVNGFYDLLIDCLSRL